MSALVILVNTINNDYGQRDAVEEAVTRALAGRNGNWSISLMELRDDDDAHWRVVVQGPDDLRRVWTFKGDEREPAIVRATMERDLAQASLPVGWELSVA
jgi:hypothetical protein